MNREDLRSAAVLRPCYPAGARTIKLPPLPAVKTLADCVRWFAEGSQRSEFHEAEIHWRGRIITRKEALEIYNMPTFPNIAVMRRFSTVPPAYQRNLACDSWLELLLSRGENLGATTEQTSGRTALAAFRRGTGGPSGYVPARRPLAYPEGLARQR
jgi:hypothetical protein